MILKIWWVLLKNQGRGTQLYFEIKMAATRSTLKVRKNFKIILLQKKYLEVIQKTLKLEQKFEK